MDIKLKDNEKIDDLEFKNLKIIQNTNSFCFGIDAILLSDFASNIKKEALVMDLGTGTGILPILLSAKTELHKIVGVEVQKDIANMAQRSVHLNKLESKVEILESNILDLEKIYKSNTFDAIVTNPPYKKLNSGIVNSNEQKLISRHEVSATLEDFIKVSFYLLKDKGNFYMIHRPERLVDILFLMRKYKLEPKELRMVYSNKNTCPKMVLIKGVKNGNSFLRVDENLYVYDDNGDYTDEIYRIYNKI